MLFVDHIAAGIVLPSLVEPFQNAPAVTVSVLSSLLPDIAGLYALNGNIRYLSHRRYTHNLLLVPFICIIPAALVSLVFSAVGWRITNTLIELYLLSVLSYVLHIAIDTFTPFGSQILYPLSTRKLNLDILTSFDPITYAISTAFIITFLYQVFTHGFPNPLLFRVYMVLCFSYVVFALIRKFLKSRKFRRYLRNHYPGAVYINTIPRPFWRWKGIGKMSSTYIVVSDGKGEDKCKLYPTDIDIPDEIKATRHYKDFMAYARFPAPIVNNGYFSLTNLLYNPYSLRLTFVMDEKGKVIPQKLTGVKIPNRGI